MAKPVPITCEGVQFPSIKALCIHYGVVQQKVVRRLSQGWTPEQSVDLIARSKKGSRGIPIEFNGILYGSLVEASNAFGVDPSTVAARVRKGYSIDDALMGQLKGRSGNRAKPIEFQGKQYDSREELCSKYGERWSNVQRRVNRGWTLEQALLIAPPPPRYRDVDGNARKHTWTAVRINDGNLEPAPDADGFKLYLITNMKNSKVYVGLTVNSLKRRLEQHFSAAKAGVKTVFANAIRKYGEQAFKIELINAEAKSFIQLQQLEVAEIAKRDSIRTGYNTAQGGSLGTTKEIIIEGKTFPSYAMAAEVFGVDPSVLSIRLTRLSWSPEEAVGLVPRDWESKEVAVTVEGRTHVSIKRAAEFYGKSYGTVHNRYRARGWTLEQALDIVPPPESSKYGGIGLVAFGKTYDSFVEAGRALGVNPESFRKRIQSGMTPEEAYRSARKKTGLLLK